MSGASPASSDIFDVKRIRRLVELMNEHDLGEIDLRQGEQRIKIRKGQEPVFSAPVAHSAPVAPAPTAASTPAAPAPAAAEADPNLTIIRSEMVGTFYAAPSPDSPPFVKVGDRIGVGSTLCVIEAMKVFNEIPANIAGQIVAVLVENGEPVEFDQPLFKLDTRK